MEIKDIVKVETLPKIVQQLEQLSVEIDNEVNQALSLECNEDSKQEVKKARANINKIKTELEDRRKDIKAQILEPYYRFEDIYNNLIKEKLIYADETLKDRVNEIENIQKQEKENNINDFFKEYAESLNLIFNLSLEDLGIKINLSDSEKKLREEVKCKLDKISNDIKLIELEEYAQEILLEYNKNGFDFAKAKLSVYNRLAEMQKIKETMLKKQDMEKIDKILEEKVDNEIVIPVEETKNAEPIITTRFQVYGTREQLTNLKQYMLQNDIKFESI